MDLFAWLTEPFSHGFMWRAAVAAALMGVGASLLGCVLVVRRMALMGDALAHALLPGVGVAWLLMGASLPAMLVGGAFAGGCAAASSALVARLTRVKEDAAFAALFAVLFAGGVALVSRLGTPVDLLHFLFGNILATGREELILAAVVSALTVAVFALFHRPILLECFDPGYHRASGSRSTLTHLGLEALVVVNLVAALHALGTVLALGLFLLPAVTAYLWCERWERMLALATGIAVLGSLSGLILSYHLALPSGPSIVLALGTIFLASTILSPRHGLLARLLPSSHHQQEDADEECRV
jgi:zinc/manganese transport system permease protein